ncbi:hypothetical protein [Rhizobium sp. MHM7A]|uniref:hypothetical protein n=1 Tax=Rhizobium sp. MHM7A TaxID=2583233 RepID=UPI0011066DD2|nr:hypothetical protein [Rhizobium sp. MHM7A]TLX17125.1 hypothetical protein FFR93_07380 [Rhizobium sp. MHM7A]
MFNSKQSASQLAELLGRFLHEDVQVEEGKDKNGQPTLKLIDHEQEIGIEISAEVGSSMHGYSASLRMNEIDAFTPPALTDKQAALPLERGRIGYHFWNRIGVMEGPLKVSSRRDVHFTSTGDNDGYWHEDGRFAWAGDKKHKHPRDLVKRIIPPGEGPDEE